MDFFTRKIKYRVMDKIFNWEQWRIIAVSAVSPVLAFLTPTKGFVFALVIMFAFNVWAGVSVVRCRNFSFRKFKNALAELLLYLIISETIYSIMLNCGDDTAALIVMKSLTYVFTYVYVQNAFRNLIHAYPTNKALRIIYHVIRFEFKRALPENVQRIVERVEREHGEEINEEFTDKNKEEEK
jgi:hypothetical protein